MGNPILRVETVDGTSATHGSDVNELRARGLHLPHQYSSWPTHDSHHNWRWCRVLDRSARLVTGFMIELSRSRAIPGTSIGRIERLGRGLHEEVIAELPRLLQAAAKAERRMQRLDIRVFDEQPQRRRQFEQAILDAGGTPATSLVGYASTTILPLFGSDEELLQSLNARVRRRMLSFSRGLDCWTSRITDTAYMRRLAELHKESFLRTGTRAPELDFRDMFNDAIQGDESILVGAFVADRKSPENLVAFGWGRFHGDHVVYEVGGSERSDMLKQLTPGYAVMWHLAQWARSRSAAFLDLGGVAGSDEPEFERLQGISRFKRHIAGPDVRVASEFQLIARPNLNLAARIARGSMKRLRFAVEWTGSGRARSDRNKRPQAGAMIPVLVLGDGLTALGVLRICHRSGIPAYSLGRSSGMDRLSRWYHAAPADETHRDEPTTLNSLLSQCRLPTAVLMPCSDTMAMQTSKLEGELASRFPASISAPTTMSLLVNKAAFAEVLRALGIPHPATVLVSRPEDIAGLTDSVLRGAFLKPHDSQAFFNRFSVKAFRIGSREDGIARMRDIEAAGQRVLLQEYIPGPGSLHYLIDGFVDRGGTVRGLLTRRRLRMHPRDFGNSSFMVSVPPDEVAQAVQSVTTLLAHIGFRGIFSAEFKHDPRDGLFKILEVNARPWWYIEFTERCGLNVCSMAYRDALEIPVETVSGFKVGKRLVYPYYDYFACRDAWREGEMTLANWALSWIGAQQPLFNWTDPIPALYEAWTTAGYRALRSLGLHR